MADSPTVTRRGRGRAGGHGALAVLAASLLALGLSACSDEAEPVPQVLPTLAPEVLQYDATLEPSAAVLPLVPTSATSLSVTDFEQLRLILGFAILDSSSPESEQARYRAALANSPALSPGLLAAGDARLRADFGFGAADVAWQAEYDGPDGAGWVIVFTDDVPMDSVRRAVRAGVAPLAGAVVDAERHYVTSATPPAAEESWGAEPDLVALVGSEASSTYVARGCLEFDAVFGAGMQADLASDPEAALEELDPLDGFAVALGGELVTVQLGEDRPDAFDRARLADLMPRTRPEFGTVFARSVADPGTGRLGYDLARPADAARLVTAGTLPFAVCAD